jgi:hypothetical protein
MPSIRLDHIKEAFLHPKQAQGIVVQLVENAAAAGAEPPAALPEGRPDAPPPVRILGLRLRAHARGGALVQWRDVLEGEAATRRDGGLAFHWPDSPMHIVVDVDPTAAEGPLAIELASPRALPELEAAGRRLGIRLASRTR